MRWPGQLCVCTVNQCSVALISLYLCVSSVGSVFPSPRTKLPNVLVINQIFQAVPPVTKLQLYHYKDNGDSSGVATI